MAMHDGWTMRMMAMMTIIIDSDGARWTGKERLINRHNIFNSSKKYNQKIKKQNETINKSGAPFTQTDT